MQTIIPESLTILMAQINVTVGAIETNTSRIIEIIESHQLTHDIIVFPELVITGYPPEDLLLRPEFYQRVQSALDLIQSYITQCHVVIGHPFREQQRLYNAASVFYQKSCLTRYFKQHLPNYGVFDEQRYFQSGPIKPTIIPIKNHQVGICICEDIWRPGPVEQIIKARAQVLLCLNASPFEVKKPQERENILQNYAKQGLFIAYVNLVGGQDELVFDGQSLAYNSQGHLIARAATFTEHLQTINTTTTRPENITLPLSPDGLIYHALCCGLRDYVHKNNFSGVLLGLSGGIDSALTLAIAVDALGPANVHAVMMPSRYTATISHDDAIEQLKILQVHFTNLSIEPTFKTLLETLQQAWGNAPTDVTEENLQARIRGVLLMALSNKTGKLVISTSNKSETAVGYATLYGDMCGGFSVLKDVLKTQVYALAHYRNTISRIIPERVINRPPSAELAYHQTDQDSLPDYAVLDAIITLYMENKFSAEQITACGCEPSAVHKTVKLIQQNEYKRKQSAPGVKISPCAFGRDWRYPITYEKR